jgi:NADH-quinone oxidoreductase subunit F
MTMKNSELVFNTNPDQYLDLSAYRQKGGYSALANALQSTQSMILDEIKKSELKGRGGAAFPVGLKIESVRDNIETERYIICNADEGEPGTFKDRFVMTHSPYQLLEGIAIAAYLAGAANGFIYVRHEYPEVQKILRESIQSAISAGLLGENILGSKFSLKLEIFSGAGSYLCGEETALLSSMEGKKGRPRLKPPYPTKQGLWGKPTLINNVETLANLPVILEKGAEWYRSLGTPGSRGTKLISLSGDVRNRGVFEVQFGTTIREIIENFGGGIKNGRTIKAVNIGGASGVLIPPSLLDPPLDYDICRSAGITIGSGAIFVLDDSRSILENVQNRVKFFLHESCGKCVPCREGLRQANVLMDKILEGMALPEDVETLERYTRVIQSASFCGLGQAAGNSLSSSLNFYRDEYLSMCLDQKEEGIA